MGLDMYLSKKIYVKNWEYTNPDEKYKIDIKQGGQPVDTKIVDPAKVEYVVEQVGYWRKANAIHNWFVEHVQEGKDDCKSYYVSREKLVELLGTVSKVLKASKLVDGKVQSGKQLIDGEWQPVMEDGKFVEDPSVAQRLLPTTSGFFFGSTEYDQWYVEDLRETKKILTKALENEGDSFEYQASW